MSRNVLITLCYDGSGYHGWQVQQNAISVQQVFQEALYKILSERPSLKGAAARIPGSMPGSSASVCSWKMRFPVSGYRGR